MMNPTELTRDEVIDRSRKLPGFPRIVMEILAALDDPRSSLKVLASCVDHDPVISARVLAAANRASKNARSKSDICDVYEATAAIGTRQVSEIVLMSSVGQFIEGCRPEKAPTSLWAHSVAAGVSGVEIIRHTSVRVSPEMAFVAGLLHDIGQFWLYLFRGDIYRECWSRALESAIAIEVAEIESFGVDYTKIGAWLAEHWGLPRDIASAIGGHRTPDDTPDELLVSLLHVADVLCNALDTTGREENRVTAVSGSAFDRVGIICDETVLQLFGNIEARSSQANLIFSER